MKKEHHVKEEKFIRKPIERTAVSYKEGLSNLLVQERMEKGWTNRAVESPEKTNGQIVKDNIVIIPIGIALFLQSYLYQKTGFSESIVSMVAAVIGMIPEGLYLLATIAMAVSAVRLAQNQVLLHDMKSIETLARVNVLCVDKTGTITKNEMEICELINPIRDNAKQTFQYFTEQGVRIKVISGDNPLTVSRIAKEAGINGSQNYIDATKLKSSQQLDDALKKYTVFGRVTPEQKRKIVQCLQKSGNTVAMTGDGVNDVLEYGTCRQRVNPLYYYV